MKIHDDVEQLLPKYNFDPKKHNYIIVVHNPERLAGTDIERYLRIKHHSFAQTYNRQAVYYSRTHGHVTRHPTLHDYPNERTNLERYTGFIEIII